VIAARRVLVEGGVIFDRLLGAGPVEGELPLLRVEVAAVLPEERDEALHAAVVGRLEGIAGDAVRIVQLLGCFQQPLVAVRLRQPGRLEQVLAPVEGAAGGSRPW
jgi:hypothetical protein